jgi:hypothetical protein
MRIAICVAQLIGGASQRVTRGDYVVTVVVDEMKSCGRKVESKVTQALLLQKLHFWIFACDQKFF